MFEEVGELLGQLIIFFYVLTILDYILKFINRKFRKEIKKYDVINTWYNKILKIIVTKHKWFGFLTVVFIIAHFLIQFSDNGLSLTGSVAALAMLFQVLLGIYGTYIIKRGKMWLYLHRTISVIILIAILIHTA